MRHFQSLVAGQPEAVIPQAGQIDGRRLSHSHLGQHISRRRADPEAMSGECTAHIEALDLFHRRNDRGAVPAHIQLSAPGADYFHALQIRHIFQEKACDPWC